MRIAVAGPTRVSSLADLLHDDVGRLELADPGWGSPPVTDLVRALVRQGQDVVVTACHPEIRTPLVLEGQGLRVHLGPYRKRRRGRDLLRLEREHVERSLRADRPDVVHAHWTYEYAWGALASGVPTVVTVRDWGPAILRLQPIPYRVVRLLMQLRVLRWGREFTVTSPYLLHRVRRWARGSTELIPNAVADELFAPEPAPRPGGRKVLLAINKGFDRRKNVTTLLRAFASLRQQTSVAVLRLVGDQYAPGGTAERWAREHGLADGVEFHGEVPNERVPELLRAAYAFVHPSLEESFGRVLVEAMAQGIPVVAGRDAGAVAWVLDEGRAGVLADVTSVASLAATLGDLLQDPARAERIGRAGHAHAQRFRQSAVLGDYLRIYERLAAVGS